MAHADLVLDARAELGEGPAWDAETSQLLWVDIVRSQLHLFDPGSGGDRLLPVSQTVGAAVPASSGRIVLARRDGFALLDPANGSEHSIAACVADGVRMNDGKCDPQGRFWAGTMAEDSRPGAGSLYRLDADHTVTEVLTGLTISNGMAWSADNSQMYFIDTMDHGVDVFDVDPVAGTLSGRRRLVDIAESDGLPDGMTIDAEDHLWVALWGGWSLRRYRPDGVLDGEISLPVANVTSCAFGGDDLGHLYITTASLTLTEQEREEQPLAGGVFRARPGVTGTPTVRYAG